MILFAADTDVTKRINAMCVVDFLVTTKCCSLAGECNVFHSR